MEKVKITFTDGTEKIIETENNDLLKAYKDNDIDAEKVRGIDKVGEE